MNRALLWIGFVLVSLNLRLIFATVGPLMNKLELGVTSTMLVTALPLALLGVFSIPGVHLRRKLGEERALFLALFLLCVGAVLGASGSFPLFVWMGGDRHAAYRTLALWAVPAGLAMRWHRPWVI